MRNLKMSVVKMKIVCLLLILTHRVQSLSSFARAEFDFIDGEDEPIFTALDLDLDLDQVEKEIAEDLAISNSNSNQEIYSTTKGISNPKPLPLPMAEKFQQKDVEQEPHLMTSSFDPDFYQSSGFSSDPNQNPNSNPTSPILVKYDSKTPRIPYIAVVIVIFAIFVISFCFVAAALIWHVRSSPFG